MARLSSLVRRRELILIVVLVLVAAGLGLYLLLRPGEQDQRNTAAAPSSSAKSAPKAGPLAGLERREPNDPMAMGDLNAPVVLVEFSDYRCPFCAKFGRETEPELVQRYVKTGKLRIEWRDFPIFGDQSKTAAIAGRAAAAQGKFWEFNKAVFDAAPQHGHPDLPKPKLLEFAKQAGVPDLAKFERDLGDPKYASEMEQDASAASGLGVPSTPAFVINGTPLLGAQPLEEFTKRIDAAGGAK